MTETKENIIALIVCSILFQWVIKPVVTYVPPEVVNMREQADRILESKKVKIYTITNYWGGEK